MEFKQVEAEEGLYLNHFTNQDAFKLGEYLSKIAINKQYPILIHIERNNQIIFQYANDGTSKNNQYWIKKKVNVVKQFNKSSAYIAKKLEKDGLTFKQKYGDDKDYAVTPGAMPIKVKNVGVVAIIAISGLDSDSDHQLIISGINYLLSIEKEEAK